MKCESKLRRMRWARHKEVIKAYRMLVRKSERKVYSGRPKCGWEDNIEIDLTKNVERA
jgi:hypothetical protein